MLWTPRGSMDPFEFFFGGPYVVAILPNWSPRSRAVERVPQWQSRYDLVSVDTYDAGQLLKKISVWPQFIRLNIFWW